MRHSLLTIVVLTGLLAAGGPAAAQEILTNVPSAPAEPAARSWTHVRVTTADGWHLDDVTVAWLENGTRVRVTQADDTWKDYRPVDIVKVEAADGTDLTSEIAKARPDVVGTQADDAGTSGLGPHRVAPVHRAFSVAVTGGITYAGYAGDWFENFNYKADTGLAGSLRIGGLDTGWLTLSYRRQGGGSTAFSYYDNDGNTLHGDVNLRVDEYRFMYGLPTKPLVTAHRVPYAELGIAVMRSVATADIPGYGSGSDSVTKGGPVVRLGGLIGIGSHGVIDLGVDVVHKPAFIAEGPGGTIFGAHAAVGYVAW